MSIIEFFIALLAPHICAGCSREGSVLCVSCRGRLQPVDSRCYRCGSITKEHRTCSACRKQTDLRQVWPATRYEATARQVVHYLKYARAKRAAIDIALVMARNLSKDERWVIVPAPTTSRRARQRGYDQAQLIAQSLAKQLDCPALPLLERQTQHHQVGQSGVQRRTQMKHAFRVTKPRVVQKTHILLIDDVLTTGATLEAAAAALCQAGAASVQAAVFAQA